MHIIGGLIGITVGVLVIRFSVWITDNFGRIEWAEEHLHSGFAGTYTFYRLVGLIFVILSLLYMFNAIGFLIAPLASVFSGVKPH